MSGQPGPHGGGFSEMMTCVGIIRMPHSDKATVFFVGQENAAQMSLANEYSSEYTVGEKYLVTVKHP